VQLGTRYLRYLHERFNGNSMLAVGSYNGGPGAMSRWVNGSPLLAKDPDLFVESIPYAQTRDYIKEVFSHYWNYKQLYGS
jgi:soluble lytic murein transglycosylase